MESKAYLNTLASVVQAIADKNGDKDAARSDVVNTDDMVVGANLSPTGDVGLETTIFFKNGSIVEIRPTAEEPIRSNRYKQPN